MANEISGTFSPEDTLAVITVNGLAHVISGFADGTYLTYARATPSAMLVQGADLTGGLVFRGNKGGTISLTLHQFTGSNDFLSMVHKKFSETRDTTWLMDITVVDGTGRTGFSASQCFISDLPETSFSTEGENRTWPIQAVRIEPHIGGNGKLPEELVATLEAMGMPISDRWKA
jgi:hypothetical protein